MFLLLLRFPHCQDRLMPRLAVSSMYKYFSKNGGWVCAGGANASEEGTHEELMAAVRTSESVSMLLFAAEPRYPNAASLMCTALCACVRVCVLLRKCRGANTRSSVSSHPPPAPPPPQRAIEPVL